MEKHIHYFDRIRLFAIISVIFMHVAADPLRLPLCADWHFLNIFTGIGFTAVPLFFMMSGFLLLSNPKTENMDLLFKKRLPKLVVPLIAWTVVALLWFYYLDRTPANFLDRLIDSIKNPAYVHFWYIYTLIAIYILSPVICAALSKLGSKAHTLIFVIAILPSVQYILSVLLPASAKRFVDFDIINKLTFFDGHLNTFLLGYFLGNWKKKVPNWVLILSAIVMIAVISFGTYALTVRYGAFNQTFQKQSKGFEVILAMILFLFFKQNFHQESKVCQTIPIIPLALSVYFMHNILLSVMMHLVPALFPVTTFFGTVFITLLNLLICFVAMKTIASIKPLCYLATGIAYATACKTCNWVYTYDQLRGGTVRNKRFTEPNEQKER